VTVPVDAPLPVTLAGTNDTDERVGPVGAGLTWIGAPRVTPPAVPLMSAKVPVPVTGLVVIVKVAEIAPAGTVTVAGTVATAVSVLASVTVVLVETDAASVAVPVEVAPPVTMSGEIVSADIVPLPGSGGGGGGGGGGGEGGGGGGGLTGVQPDSVACTDVAPSLTVTRHVLER
jgi:hypothetical protein